MSLVSVIVPVYNAAEFLSDAIESILNQTFTDFEIIAVDDGSTDSSVKILEEYCRRDRRIKIHCRPNTGIVGALNDAISMASGEFIARMDADDVCLPRRLEMQLQYLSRHRACVAVGTDVIYTDPEGSPLIRHFPAEEHESIIAQLLDGNGGALIHPTVIFRRSAIERIGGYRAEYQWVEDLDIYLRLSETGKLANLADVHLHYRQHQHSVNHTRRDRSELRKRVVDSRRLALGLAPIILDSPESMKFRLADYRRRWAYDAARGGNWAGARKNARRAVVEAPFDWRNWQCLKYTHLTARSDVS